MTSTIGSSQVAQHVDLYCNLLDVLANQLTAMEQDFFEDIEYSGDNFFVPAIKRLCITCSQIPNDRLMKSLSTLTVILSSRFPSIVEEQLDRDVSERRLEEKRHRKEDKRLVDMDVEDHVADVSEESDDDGGPVIVPSDEVEASLARLEETPRSCVPSLEYSEQDRATYPFLFAAKLEHEDVLMTCARGLDDANDVSLVREAAAYLEQVEAKRYS
jgi:A1 cistron-splicing factor AAR2